MDDGAEGEKQNLDDWNMEPQGTKSITIKSNLTSPTNCLQISPFQGELTHLVVFNVPIQFGNMYVYVSAKSLLKHTTGGGNANKNRNSTIHKVSHDVYTTHLALQKAKA